MIDTEAFLRQEIESATPAKLRMLLLRKAVGLVDVVADHWRQGKAFEARQWVIRIRDILTELLDGIVGKDNELAVSQTDLYVFLSKLLTRADETQSQKDLADFREILDIERASWELFVRKEHSDATASSPIIPPTSVDAINYATIDFTA